MHMSLDPHERESLECRIDELGAQLKQLLREPSSVARADKSLAIQLEMGELIRTIGRDT